MNSQEPWPRPEPRYGHHGFTQDLLLPNLSPCASPKSRAFESRRDLRAKFTCFIRQLHHTMYIAAWCRWKRAGPIRSSCSTSPRSLVRNKLLLFFDVGSFLVASRIIELAKSILAKARARHIPSTLHGFASMHLSKSRRVPQAGHRWKRFVHRRMRLNTND
jgi:hypothetical protein